MVGLGCATVSNLTYLSIFQPEGWQPWQLFKVLLGKQSVKQAQR